MTDRSDGMTAVVSGAAPGTGRGAADGRPGGTAGDGTGRRLVAGGRDAVA